MFGRSFYTNPPVEHKEHYSHDNCSGYRVRINVLDDGSLQRENFEIDLNQPKTPQSGIETKICDLSFALKAGMSVSSERCQLSALDNTNPLNSFRAAKSLADTAETHLSNKKK